MDCNLEYIKQLLLLIIGINKLTGPCNCNYFIKLKILKTIN